jgi:hypothetical protein
MIYLVARDDQLRYRRAFEEGAELMTKNRRQKLLSRTLLVVNLFGVPSCRATDRSRNLVTVLLDGQPYFLVRS